MTILDMTTDVRTKRRRGRPPKTEDSSKADQLLQAALTTFAEIGYEGAGLRQIAARVGVDVAMINHFFGSKLKLWEAVIDHTAQKVINAVQSTACQDDASLSSRERLRRAMLQLIDVMCDAPLMAQFVVRESIQEHARFEYMYLRLVKPMHDLLTPMIRDAVEAGEIGDVDPDFMFFTFTASVSMAIAARRYSYRFSPVIESDERFRHELKCVLQQPFVAQPVASTP